MKRSEIIEKYWPFDKAAVESDRSRYFLSIDGAGFACELCLKCYATDIVMEFGTTVVAWNVNFYDSELRCSHCGEGIPAKYA